MIGTYEQEKKSDDNPNIIPTATHLVVVCGSMAVGKSTLGEMLAEKLEAALIDKDEIGTFAPYCPNYSALSNDEKYALIDVATRDVLCAGASAVIVAPNGSQSRETEQWRSSRES